MAKLLLNRMKVDKTRNVFENIRAVLREAVADMKDIMMFNTFYVFEGEGDEIREFWEKMTKVRMQFSEEPGRVEQASGYRVLPTPIC